VVQQLLETGDSPGKKKVKQNNLKTEENQKIDLMKGKK
jgi:hypothetical protein